MRRALAVAVLAGFTVTGCAVPRWVPFLGKPASRPSLVRAAEPARMSASEAVRRPAPERRTAGQDPTVVDRVVAVVNNDAITLGELLEAIAIYRQENRQAAPGNDDELARQFLPRLIDTRLQLQEADREKITTEDAEVDEELAEVAKKVGAKNLEELAAMGQAQGVHMDTLRKRTRERLRMTKLVRRRVAQRVTVTEDEVHRYLGANRPKLETGLAYHARHILIVPADDSEAAWARARERADALHAELVAGADFAALAREHSGDATARDGGDLGTLKRGELAEDIETEIVRLQPGTLSRPYRSALGWHIFRLESRETLEGEALSRVRQQIRDILMREKYEARFDAWMRELKQRAIIDVRL